MRGHGARLTGRPEDGADGCGRGADRRDRDRLRGAGERADHRPQPARRTPHAIAERPPHTHTDALALDRVVDDHTGTAAGRHDRGGARPAAAPGRQAAGTGDRWATTATRSAATGSTPTTTAATSATTSCSATRVPGDRRGSRRQDACDHDVLAGTWHDPYTGRTLRLHRPEGPEPGRGDPDRPRRPARRGLGVRGGARWSDGPARGVRQRPRELLAVDGPTNMSKGDGDPAAWRPRQGYQCTYARRWIDDQDDAGDLAVDPSEKSRRCGRCSATAADAPCFL